MGLLDYFKTLNQPNQQGLTFVDRASMNPLLQAGIGILANNTGNYGQFGPVLAKGVGYGLQNVGQYKQQQADNKDREVQRLLYGQQISAQMKKAQQDAEEDQAAQNQAKYMFKTVGLDFDNLDKEVGGFMPVSSTPKPIKSSPLPGGYNLDISDFVPNVGGSQMMTSDIPVNTEMPQVKPSKLNALFDKWGWEPEEREVFAAQAQADPKGAAKFLQQEMIARRKAALTGRKEKVAKPFEGLDTDTKTAIWAAGITDPNDPRLADPKFRQTLVRQADTSRRTRAPSQTVYAGSGIPAGEATETLSKDFGKFAQAATENAQNAYDTAEDISMIEQGLRGMGGGPVAEFKAFVGRYFPADSELGKVASMNELAKTVQAKLAPQARAVGSGATSDFEMRMYMAAIPTLSTTENGRALMAKYARRVAERQQLRAEIVNNIEQEGKLPTPAEIKRRMGQRLGDTFFDAQDRAFFGVKNSQPQQAAPKPQPAPAASGANVDDLLKKYGGK